MSLSPSSRSAHRAAEILSGGKAVALNKTGNTTRDWISPGLFFFITRLLAHVTRWIKPSIASALGYHHATSLQRISPNPERIAPSSPGLRGTSNPGTTEAMRHYPNGVASASHDRSHNPVGVAARPTMFSQGSSCLATLGYCARIPLGFAFDPIKDVGTVAKSRSSRSKELLAIRPFESVTSVAAFPDCYQVFPGTETRSARIKGSA